MAAARGLFIAPILACQGELRERVRFTQITDEDRTRKRERVDRIVKSFFSGSFVAIILDSRQSNGDVSGKATVIVSILRMPVAILRLLIDQPFLGTVDDVGIHIGEGGYVRQEAHGVGSERGIRRTVAPITEPAAGLAIIKQTVIADADVATGLCSASEHSSRRRLCSISAT